MLGGIEPVGTPSFQTTESAWKMTTRKSELLSATIKGIAGKRERVIDIKFHRAVLNVGKSSKLQGYYRNNKQWWELLKNS